MVSDTHLFTATFDFVSVVYLTVCFEWCFEDLDN